MTGVSGSAGVGGAAACGDEPLDAVAGLALAAVLDAIDPADLDDHDLLESAAAWDRVLAWASARQAAALAEFARRPARVQVAGEDLAAVRAEYAPAGRWVREFADDEVAARLRISRVAASTRIALACDLHRLPLTRAALADGRIDLARARVLADETKELDAGAVAQVESALIDRAGRVSAASLRVAARRAVLAIDPVAARQRSARARSDRRVVVTPAADGMAELWAHLPAADAMAIDAALTSAARASRAAALPGDDRTMDQRRADLLAEPFVAMLSGRGAALATGASGATSERAGRVGRAAELQVTVAASTLLGLDDAPAELHGYGPITAEVARELAPDARWRRVLTDPRSGAVLDVGRSTYRPPAELARFVVARSPRCTFPGCRWPAAACDLDHTVPFPQGATSASNLGPRCRRHHRLKHAAGYSVTQDESGAAQWVMPTGHRYDVPPPAIGPLRDEHYSDEQRHPAVRPDVEEPPPDPPPG